MTSATAPAKAASTILVIEDYSDTRELLSVLLRRRGYNVVEAEDGVEGLLKAGWVYPDLILMDLSLPEMDGVEVARRIHAQAKLSRIPIFVVSAYLTEAVKADVRAAGCAEEVVGAILAHTPWNFDEFPRDRPIRKTLFAVDELAGFLVACALVRPSKSLQDLEVSSVKKKLKDKGFAKGVSREDIAKGVEELGTTLDEHIAFVLEALRPHERTLGLGG